MALEPCHNDPNFKEQMANKKQSPENWGAAAWQNVGYDTPTARVGRRVVAHFGLSPFAGGQINLISEKLLADAKGDESKVQIENARADLIARGILQS